MCVERILVIEAPLVELVAAVEVADGNERSRQQAQIAAGKIALRALAREVRTWKSAVRPSLARQRLLISAAFLVALSLSLSLSRSLSLSSPVRSMGKPPEGSAPRAS